MPDDAVPLAEKPTLASKNAPEAPAAAVMESLQSFGRYQILQTLGQGGMGAVYLAFDPVLRRQVAIKAPIFSHEREVALARFLRESQVVASLQHPNICPIYDVGEINHTPFLCMPYIAGKPLSQRLVPKVPSAPTHCARIIHRVALAMQYVHDKGVVHRDLKPANIMLNERDEPIVMDFGLARSADLSRFQLTSQGDVMGTPAYMPPEQVNGELELIGPASDIYSLGVILYQMLTGSTPFQGDSMTMMMQIVMDPPPLPSNLATGLSAAWDAVCMKALEKKPGHRWASMRAMAEAIEPLVNAPAEVASVVSKERPRIKALSRLTLRIVGTNLAYRAPPSVPIISVGRQKRKPQDPVDQGNDFVLRMQGNDALSARISRRHFEIHSNGAGSYSLVDKSKLGVLVNGKAVAQGTPIPLSDGDELDVASVVKLTVLIEDTQDWQLVRPGAVVAVPAPADAPVHQVVLDASLGDLCTMDGESPS